MELRIGVIAPVWERVPPERYGGTEFMVSLLTDELVRRGHEVTLFATGDSISSAKLEWVYPTAQRESHGQVIPEIRHLSLAFRQAGSFQLIHNHAGYSACAFASLVETPVLMTLHGIFTDENKAFFRAFRKDLYFNALSTHQRAECPDLRYVQTINNGIDVASYPFEENKDDYLLSFGRISPLKGTHTAIEMAKGSGRRLIIAGKVDLKDRSYFEQTIKPQLDGRLISYLGEVSWDEKLSLLKKAQALIFPIEWPEPFGLVMIEAMACGTPVVASKRGSVPEIIAEGETGFIVESLEGAIEALQEVSLINPRNCRNHVERRFSHLHMVDEYEKAYLEIICGEQRGGEHRA
jgi:glycosyltransferase involved in cell wall biosynthesis